MSRIKPTVGRVVHFRPTGVNGPTLAAIIAAVHSPSFVALSVFNEKGEQYGVDGVTLLQDGEYPENPMIEFAEWMPYQIGQAKKTEELQQSVAAAQRLSEALPKSASQLASSAMSAINIGAARIGDPDPSFGAKYDAVRVIEPKTRVTPDDLDREIERGEVVYSRIEGTTLTHCTIKLANGFSVTGESACVDPRNFDEVMGREIARKNAREKLWPLLGFRLADRRAHPAYMVTTPDLTEQALAELAERQPMVVMTSAHHAHAELARTAHQIDADSLSAVAIERLLKAGAIGVANGKDETLVAVEATVPQMYAAGLLTGSVPREVG